MTPVLLRSLGIGVLAVVVAWWLQRLLADPRRLVRRAAWMLLLAPYFTLVLLTGYAYASFSLSLIHHPAVNVLLYSALLLWKFTPVAAVILHFTPSPISAEAGYCHRLTFDGAVFRHWWFLVRAGCARGAVAAFAVVFLCAFAEFEMASLMVVKSWTVAQFDAHAGGLALGESLRRMTGPLLCEAVAITAAFIVLGGRQAVPARRVAGGRVQTWLAWCHLGAAFFFVLGLPAGMVLWGAIRGLGLLLDNFVLSREILASLLFAAGASGFAGVMAFWLGTAARGRGKVSLLSKLVLLAAVFAGLLGPLVLSLAVLAAVQSSALLWLRDTPVPLIVTLGLVLAPMALVLRRVLDLTRQHGALHLITLLEKSPAARDLTWRLSTSGKFWTMVLLFIGAYWDLTASAILAPIGMTPVTVRLYNLMHYGQIAALSAMTCATFAAPILIFLLLRGTRRWWAPQ
jgi:ABC-type Fe3+ transport system permease subunit